LAEQLEQFGADEAAIAAAVEQEREHDVCEVHPDNDEPVAIFLALQTQWRIVTLSMGGSVYLGLDYAAVPAVFGLLGIDPALHQEQFAALRVMEAAALPLLNKRADDE
jgi:hypothetical protein